MATAPLFVDTNVWLRFLTRDDEAKARAVAVLLADAEAGAQTLTLSHLVIAELDWTLRSFYDVAKAEIIEALRELVSLRSLRVPRRKVVERSLDLYERYAVDFVDAYNAADMQGRGLTTIVSYDTDFDKLGVRRLAP